MTSASTPAMTISPASSAEAHLIDSVAESLAILRSRIVATGRELDDVRIVAVTKTFSPAHVAAVAANGLHHVGENYAQELEDKRSVTSAPLTWHYLGALQTNKIPLLSRISDLIASVSRTKEIEHLGRQPRRVPVYLQIDFTGREDRNGAPLSAIEELLLAAQKAEIDVRGLMTVGDQDPSVARREFGELRRACDTWGLRECSMGMSNDLEIACDEGSTEIRVGRGLFGLRGPAPVR